MPIEKYVLTHYGDSEARKRRCVHFVTFGRSYGPTKLVRVPILLELDLSKHEAPPQELCNKYTGLDRKLADSFFSIPKNEETFRDALADLRWWRKEIERIQWEGCAACVINCNIGRHRSVAMAQRLASTVGSWPGFNTECLHIDIWKVVATNSENAVRVDTAKIPEGEDIHALGNRHRQRQKDK